MPACLPAIDAWRLRGKTLLAMALLSLALPMVRWLPFRWWRATLGQPAPRDRAAGAGPSVGSEGTARRLAVHVERAADRLPFATRCLPRAMALCWLLRAAGIAYVLKIAARPAAVRQAMRPASDDTLHAWVETDGVIVIGSLPGPWLVVLNLYG